MIIAVANEKGGSSKSTLASSLAVEAVVRGFQTLVVDADPQGTLTEWSAVGTEEKRVLPTVVAMGDQLRQQLPMLAGNYSLTFIDLPGRIAKRVAGALMVADLVLLPCGPSNADLWALQTTLGMIAEARELRPDMKIAAVITRKRPGTTAGREIRGALEGLGVSVLKTAMCLRETYADALGAGSGPTSFAASSLAASEVRRLFDEVESLLGVEASRDEVPAA
ncbi:MAG: AAA family ATPase [Sandaracinaceae bacterium]|nr:AAA family ATPase [Sandaracinaceae bacterium]